MSIRIVVASIAFLSLSSAAPLINSREQLSQPYDLVIVGAGPAGLIIADRLSETGKKTLLLEQGSPSYFVTGGTQRPTWLDGTDLSRVDVPGLYSSIFSEPSDLLCDEWASAFGGCTIGGSSAINAGLFFQPPDSDWDTQNVPGWGSKDLANSIARINEEQPSTNLTSADGIRYLQSSFDATQQWLAGAGYVEVDINAAANSKTKSYGHPIYNYDNGQRGGPATDYLQSALSRSNFELQEGVHVLRIAREGPKATGVVAIVDGAETTIPLSDCGRVIISGGALQSPALLMHSGIGDPETLQRLAQADRLGGLQPSQWINNTAVGDGLFDNPNTFIMLSSPDVTSYTYTYQDPPGNDEGLYLSPQGHSGPYSFAGQTVAFWDSIIHPDGSAVGLQGTIATGGYQDYTDANTITLNVYGTSGLKSSGRVVLNDQFLPGPDANVYYSDPQDGIDIATFIRGLFDALPSSTLTPLNINADATVEDIRSYITTPSAYAAGQVNHWSSSCRLGTCADPQTAQVIGTDNIHIVDASIVPPLTVNPQMGVMIAAERASELIKFLLM